MGAVGIEETPLGDLVRVRPLSRLDSTNSKSVLDLHCNDKIARRLLACGLHPFNTSRMMVDVIPCHHATSSPIKGGGATKHLRFWIQNLFSSHGSGQNVNPALLLKCQASFVRAN